MAGLLLVVALALAIVQVIIDRGKGLLSWAVFLTLVALGALGVLVSALRGLGRF